MSPFDEPVADRYYPGLTIRKLRDTLWANLREEARLWSTGGDPEQPVQLARGQQVLSLRYESDWGLVIRKAWGKWEPHEPVHGLTETALLEAAQDWVDARVLREIKENPRTYTFTIAGYRRLRSGEGWPGEDPPAPEFKVPPLGFSPRPVVDPAPPSRRFRIALSFAGEKRGLVHEVAHLLARQFTSERILYDKFHEAEFARPDLSTYLPDLYNKEADLVVVIVCPRYDAKEWTGLEWRAIHHLIQTRQVDRLMLCRFEYATAAGLFGGEGWVDLDGRTAGDATS